MPLNDPSTINKPKRVNPRVLFLYGREKIGKALRDDSPVLTTRGWIPINELTLFDLVAGSDGKFYPVDGVFPQGEKHMLRITFSDETVVVCSEDHLWEVFEQNKKHKGPAVKSALDLKRNYVRGKSFFRWSIRYCKPIEFPEKPLPAHPYLIGYLIADGCLRNNTFVSFSRQKLELLSKLKAMTTDELKHRSRYDYAFVGGHVKGIVAALGLNVNSSEKHIPRDYLFNSIPNRLQLLQGLMDGDGSNCARSGIEYSTSSERLAYDVQELVRGLGGKCTTVKRKSGYKNKSGNRVECLPSYRLMIAFPSSIVPFSVDYKRQKFKPKTKSETKSIVSIEDAGKASCTCISVQSGDHLFLTSGYNLTHNTTVAAQLPDSYLLVMQYEGAGADYIEFKGSKIESLEEFEQAIPQLRKWYQEKKFKRLVIDSIDALVAWLENRCTQKYGKLINKEKAPIVSTVYELDYGKGHVMATQLLKDLWAELLTCCDELVFIGHCKFTDKTQTEQKVIPKEVDLPGNAMRNFVCYAVCAAGFMFLKEGNLWVTFHAQDEIAGGSRSKHLAAQRIELAKLVDGTLKADWSKIYLPG